MVLFISASFYPSHVTPFSPLSAAVSSKAFWLSKSITRLHYQQPISLTMAICQSHAHPVSAYNLIVWVLSIILRLFYKEISTSGLSKVPTVGPTLFVAAPHSNDVCIPLSGQRTLSHSETR